MGFLHKIGGALKHIANPANVIRDASHHDPFLSSMQRYVNPANLIRDASHRDPLWPGVQDAGHRMSMDFQKGGMFGTGHGPNFGLGNYAGRRNAGIALAAALTAGMAGGAGASGAAGAGGTYGGALGALAPVAGGAGGVGFGSLAGAGGIAALGAGGASAGLAGAGAGAAASPWYNSFWGQTGINTGLNLLGGVLQNKAISGAQKQSRKDIEDRIRQALAALSPEHIMALAQQFLPQMAANASQSGQTAIQAVREQAARTGQLESPRALSFEAGTRAKLASDVQRQAFEGAFNLAGGQASAITGAPYTPIQPQMGYADAVINSANQGWFERILRSQNRQPQQQTGVPYYYPSLPQPGGSY